MTSLSTGPMAAMLLSAVALCAAPARAQALPAGCSTQTPDGCLYTPAATYAISHVDVTLADPARNGHQVPIRVRYPLGAVGATAARSTPPATPATRSAAPASPGRATS